GEGEAVVARKRQPDAAARGAAQRRIPGDVDAVAEGARRVLVRGDHRLVVEVVLAAVELEERNLRPGLAAVGRARHRHLGAVDAHAEAGRVEGGAEEDDDIPVEEVVGAVEGERRIGAEVDAVGTDRRRERQIHSAPALAVVAGEVAAHREAEDLVRAGRELRGLARIDGDEGLALRPALVGDVHVRSRRRAYGGGGERVGPVLRDVRELVPPGGVLLRIAGERGRGEPQRGARTQRPTGSHHLTCTAPYIPIPSCARQKYPCVPAIGIGSPYWIRATPPSGRLQDRIVRPNIPTGISTSS